MLSYSQCSCTYFYYSLYFLLNVRALGVIQIMIVGMDIVADGNILLMKVDASRLVVLGKHAEQTETVVT